MKQCIVICTHRENWHLFKNCLHSVVKHNVNSYPIVVVLNDAKNTSGSMFSKYSELESQLNLIVLLNFEDGFELGALKRVLEHTDYEEMLLLQDSCEIKDSKLFDLVFKTEGSVAITIGYMSYLGKYERKILERIEIPATSTKTESVGQEGRFNRLYLANVERFTVLFGRFGFSSYKGNRFEHKFGRKNLISENEYLIKYKATWSAKMIRD